MSRRSPERPRTGLRLEDALARWSDPAAYAAMREYWDDRRGVSVSPDVEPPPSVLRHQEYLRRRKPLEEALHAKLAAGELAASVLPAIRDGQTSRDVVHPGAFQDAEIAWELEMLVGMKLRLEWLEVFEPGAPPLNVWELPSWYTQAFGVSPDGELHAPARARGFRHATNYRQVELDGESFALSVAQSRVVRRLHEAYLAGDPWQGTWDLLDAANVASDKVAQLFRRIPNWKRLIESNGKGMYRLRID